MIRAKRQAKLPAPLESEEAKWLFQWVTLHEKRFPQLQMLFHIPNESMDWKRRAIMAGQGVRNGVPDYCLPVPMLGYPGLFVELKRQRGGRLSSAQQEWSAKLAACGYKVATCAGWQEAAAALIDYLELPLTVGGAAREATHVAAERPFSPKTQRPSKILPHPGVPV